MEKIQNFLTPGPSANGANDANTGPNGHTESNSDEESEFGGFSDDEDTSGDVSSKPSDVIALPEKPQRPATSRVDNIQFKLIYTPQPVPDILDAALQKIINIHTHQPLPGDILVFLTGQETVETLESFASNMQPASSRITRSRSSRSFPSSPLFRNLLSSASSNPLRHEPAKSSSQPISLRLP